MGGRRGLYDDFAGRRVPTDDELASALQNATVVVDTNVLFCLYRFSDSTRDSLLELLRLVGDRLFVPHQVVSEFWRNRAGVIAGRDRDRRQLIDALRKHLPATTTAIAAWAETAAVDAGERDEMVSQVQALQAELLSAVERHAPAAVDLRGGSANDTVLLALEELLAGRVGPALPESEWLAAVTTGNDRAKKGVPPGFLDVDKIDSDLPEGAAGDYLVWSQAMAAVAERGGDLLLVTGDEKEDWWWRHREVFVGPRPELVTELAAACGARLFMLRPADLLRRAGALNVEVRAESVDEAERVRPAPPQPTWTQEGVAALLMRLDAERWDHAAVIREAAKRGGQVDRAAIYEICGYSDDRMLRGFTRPATRITSDLQAEGLVAEGVAQALDPIYDGPGKALAFRIPYEMVEILSVGGSGDHDAEP